MADRFVFDDTTEESAVLDPTRFSVEAEGSDRLIDMGKNYDLLGIKASPDRAYSTILEFANAIPGMKEAASGANALIDSALGPETFGQAYDNYRSRWKQGVEAAGGLSESLNIPYTSTANTIAGGLASLGPLKLASALPFVGPAIGNLFGVSEAALTPTIAGQVGRQATRSALGSYAGNVAKAAAQNALAGGASGFAGGEGGLDSRLQMALDSAKLGGAIGGSGSAVFGAGGGIVRGLAPTAEDLMSSIKGIFREQPPIAARQVPDDLVVAAFARELSKSGLSPDEIAATLARFKEEVAAGNPTFVSEAAEMATGKPGLYTRTKFVGATPEAQGIAANAIAGRDMGLLTRTAKILDEVGTERAPFEVGEELQGTATKIINAAKAETGEAAEKAYSELYKTVGQVKSPEAQELLKEPMVKEGIKRAKAINRDLRKLPDDHFRVLERAYRYIRDDTGEMAKSAAKAKRAGKMTQGASEANDIKDSFVTPLRDELDKHAANYKAIRDEYGEMMDKIRSIDKSGVDVLESLKENQLDVAVDKLFDQSPKQIKRFLDALDTYAPEGRILMRDAARVRLSNSAYNTEQYGNVFKKWSADDPVMNQKLELILGKKGVEKLNQSAKREQVYQVAKGRYAVGSQTDSRAMERESKKNFVSKIARLAKSPFKVGSKSLDVAFEPREDLLNEALAKAFFEPQYGLQMLKKSLPLAQRQARNQNLLLNAPDLGQALMRAFSTPSGTVAGALTNLNRGE